MLVVKWVVEALKYYLLDGNMVHLDHGPYTCLQVTDYEGDESLNYAVVPVPASLLLLNPSYNQKGPPQCRFFSKEGRMYPGREVP